MNMAAPGAADGPAKPKDEHWARVLENLVRILAGYPLKFVPFYLLNQHGEDARNTERRWRAVMGLEEIQYLSEDIDDPDRRVSLGRASHEVWHVTHSVPELIFDEPVLIKSMAFQALWWAVEDTRVNQVGMAEYPGAEPWIEAYHVRDVPVDDAARAAFAKLPLHIQFNYALIYEWAALRFGWRPLKDPRVLDPRVRAALDMTDGARDRAAATADAARSFRIVRDEIWPVYLQLVDEAYEQAQRDKQKGKKGKKGQKGPKGEKGEKGEQGEPQDGEQQDGEEQDGQQSQKGQQGGDGSQGQKKPGEQSGQQGGEQGGQPGQQKGQSGVDQDVRDEMEKAETEFRDKHASKVVDKPESMSDAQREQAKREMQEMRDKMKKGKGQSQKGKQGKGQKGDAGQPQDGGGGGGDGDEAARVAQAAKDLQMDAKKQAEQREKLKKPDQRRQDINVDNLKVYEDYMRRIRHLIPTARQQFLMELRRKLRQRELRDRRSGELDEDRMADIPSGEPHVFTQRMIANKALYRVSLLIDVSGSMDKEKKDRAIEGALLLMEMLEGLPGVAYEVVMYGSTPAVLKAYSERIAGDRKQKAAIVKEILLASGSTEAHVALREAIQRIRMGRGEKLIIMVNDGDPDNNFDRKDYRAMIKAASDVEVHGIGLGPLAQLVLDLFPPRQGWWLADAAELARSLRQIIKKKLLGGTN